MSRNLRTSLIINEILKVLAATSIGTAVVIAPNALKLSESALRFLDKRERKLKTKQFLQYMKKKQLIEYRTLPDGNLEIEITEMGKKRVQQVSFDALKIKKLKKWDEKWRLVMFDIPERRRGSRSALSMKLRSLGFYQLQKSA